MKIKFLLLILFFLFTKCLIFSQEIYEVKNLIVTNELKGVLTVEIYYNKEMHKNEKCTYPLKSAEQKFCEFFNLNTKAEIIKFFMPYDIPSSYSNENYLDKMKIYDKKDNFYALESKYIFDYGINKDIFIKYINHNEIFPKPVYSANYLQDFNNELILKGMGENFDIGLFLISSDTEKTLNYLNKSANSTIDISLFCTDFLENIKSTSSKNSLYDLMDKKYSPFFSDKTDEGTVPKENPAQNIFTYNYKKKFHDLVNGIVLKKNKMSKKEISGKYNIPIENLVKDSLSVKEVIDVNTMNNNFTIIKFYDSKPIIKTSYEIIDNDLIYKNSSSLVAILSQLNLDFFVELCVNDKSMKFPEANKLQPLIKNSDGSVNINKLADVIGKNKILLSKYLDE